MSKESVADPEIGLNPWVLFNNSNLVYSLCRIRIETSMNPDCIVPKFSITTLMFISTPTTPSVTYKFSGLSKLAIG